MLKKKRIEYLEKKIADFETFEKGVCTIIDGYFKTNEQDKVHYSMDNAVDKFWHFAKSVDNRLNKLERELLEKSCDLELEKIKAEKLKEEVQTKIEELVVKDDNIATLNAIIKEQEAQIAKLKKKTEKGSKKNGV